MIEEQNINEQIIDPNAVCMRAFELMGAKDYDDAQKLLLNNLSKAEDEVSIALYHSVLGVLFKMKGEFKEAWRHYNRAEKLLPNDPALKIISARLLIEQFAEYSQAIRKAKKVLDIIPNNPVFAHQAYTTIGLAYLKKGSKHKAVEMLVKSSGNDFEGFVSGKNIDLSLLEGVLRKGWGIEEAGHFLKKALKFCRLNEEPVFTDLFQGLNNKFDAEYSLKASQ